ncbi:2-oxoisovalerate dehydrogenase E1 component alpha subunit [Rhizomicrobium palustre]|uniref:2-oxoisovalerate dehydrogenase subunit alpha n=1 Tax=Rhizomicrobium palustre TaxID=189966 RepID=A0A846N290_9PROT|nr:thiamine pyrophosphate-dependent enzyme [Rhizomicrobium palustre]NIK89247.1 2-oxoisovalerate dehydrogenase E1 component alpha subunit [Rhizomicrobium palustre]
MRNRGRLSLRIPQPPHRPGDTPDFSNIIVPPAGAMDRPPVDAKARDMIGYAYGLIRVLDENGQAVGQWNPRLGADVLKKGLRDMMLTRAYDDRMYRVQRQGKISFYVKSTGEEAVSVASAHALERDDMCFPAYRQQGFLIARGYPLLDMMCQCFSNARDPIKGRQLPVMYSSREYGFFTVSGNLGTQFPQAVGWALASAYKNDDKIAVSFIGEGTSAEGDFHHALNFASVYRAPVVLNVVNNQWAISSFSGIAGGEEATFASRAIGYSLPGLRVDGNDYLAVYAAMQWAAERARANLGATLIEHYTYRAEAHSTSDDPSRYRPTDEWSAWPLGDPVARLKQHMIAIGIWSEEQHLALAEEIAAEVREIQREAESIGTLAGGSRPQASTMFEDVFAEVPWHLEAQKKEAGV